MEMIKIGISNHTLKKLHGLLGTSIYLRTSTSNFYQMSIDKNFIDLSLGAVLGITKLDHDIREKPNILLSVKSIGDSLAGYDFKGIEDSINEENLTNQINFGFRRIKTIKLHYYRFDGKIANRPKERKGLFVDACTGITFGFESGETLLLFPPHLPGSGFYLLFYGKNNQRDYKRAIRSRTNVYNERLLAIEEDISAIVSLCE